MVSKLHTKLLHPVSRGDDHDDGDGDDDEVLVLGEWSCLVCDWHCESEKQLRAHQKNHNLQQCTRDCDKAFPANHMPNHIKKCGIQPIKKCDKCIYETNDEANLREHKRIYHTNQFECPSCDQKFKSENKLEKHEFTVHNKRFQCMHCDKTFPYRYNRDRHVQAWVYIIIYTYLFTWSPGFSIWCLVTVTPPVSFIRINSCLLAASMNFRL